MNDLENLRKRAKQLVRQHNDRDYIVAERIRHVLPRFHGMTDREVLDTAFALHDAQTVIAQELGVASWAELREAPPMSTSIATTDVRLRRGLPFLDYQLAGADFQERLQKKPWNAIEFVIRDPDGNLILFGSPS